MMLVADTRHAVCMNDALSPSHQSVVCAYSERAAGQRESKSVCEGRGREEGPSAAERIESDPSRDDASGRGVCDRRNGKPEKRCCVGRRVVCVRVECRVW